MTNLRWKSSEKAPNCTIKTRKNLAMGHFAAGKWHARAPSRVKLAENGGFGPLAQFQPAPQLQTLPVTNVPKYAQLPA